MRDGRRAELALDELLADFDTHKISGAAALATRTSELLGQIAEEASAGGRDAVTMAIREASAAVVDRFGGISPVINGLHAIMSALESAEPSEWATPEASARVELAVAAYVKRIDDGLCAAALAVGDLVQHGDAILAFTIGETVLRGLVAARSRGKEFVVIVAGQDPAYLERVTCELAREGIRITVMSDLALAWGVSRSSCVIVGADAIALDGSILSRIGTRALAVVARSEAVPFWVAADSTKTDLAAETGQELRPRERGKFRLRRDRFPADTILFAPDFEMTPGSLVTGLITESGPVCPADCHALANTLPKNRRVMELLSMRI